MSTTSHDQDLEAFNQWCRENFSFERDTVWIGNASRLLYAFSEGNLPGVRGISAWMTAFHCSRASIDLFRTSLIEGNLSRMQHILAVMFLLRVGENVQDDWLKKALNFRTKEITMSSLAIVIVRLLLSKRDRTKSDVALAKKTLLKIRKLQTLPQSQDDLRGEELMALLEETERQLSEISEQRHEAFQKSIAASARHKPLLPPA